MKTTNRFFTAIAAMLLLFSSMSFSQEDKRPMYVTVTTMYWSSDSDMSMADWKAGEKEYMEKVTKKNEYIMWAGYFLHLMTSNSNEILYAQTYPSWEAIEKASARNVELEKEAWPDEATRKAFLDKMNSAYAHFHSDEIYATIPGAKTGTFEITDNTIMYMRKNKRAFPKDGSWDEYSKLNEKFLANVINKNDYIKAYYPSVHAWGADRRDFIEVFYLDSMEDLDKMFNKSQELMKGAFTKEESMAMGKYFKSHGDYVYSVVKL